MSFPRPILPLLFLSALAGQTPRIFFSDLDSGPKTGGENNLGVYVTVYGTNFGSSRGTSTVTIGGGAAANYPIWTNTKVTFQLGAAAAAGEIRVRTGGGVSNGVPFSVRTGNVLFVSPAGADTNSGSFSSPYRTVQKAVDSMAPGDTAYLMNGVVETRPGTSDGSVTINRNDGAAGAHKALVGYPGAVATIGSTGSAPCISVDCIEGLKTAFASSYWTIAGLRLVGNDYGIVVRGTNWRVVGNELTCPWGNGASACLDATQASYIQVWGNNVHDAGFYRAPKDQSSDLYHGIYFSTDSNFLDIGWNRIENIKGCRGIQIHSSRIDATTGGNSQYGISIHDNIIRNTQCDGIVLATINPSLGAISIYNNLIQNAGQGPVTLEGGGNFACIYATGYNYRPPVGSGVVDIYNNTLVNCGFANPYGIGGVTFTRQTSTIDLRLRNNIFYQTNGAPYIDSYDGPTGILGSNNLFFGNGPAPSFPGLSASISGDPRFVNPAGDFHLLSGSPARGSGADTGLVTDLEGTLRGIRHDLGAFVGTGAFAPPPVLSPGFSLSTNPSTITLTEGASAITTTVSLSPVNGFSGTAALTCTPAVPGVTCLNSSVSALGPVTLTLGFPGLRAGTYAINILGQAGSVSATTVFTLVIQPPSGGGFGGGGTGGLGGGTGGGGTTGGGGSGGTGSTASTGSRSLIFRYDSGWARAQYVFVPLGDFRFEARVHGVSSANPGYIFQSDSPEVGGLAIRSRGAGVRLQVVGLTDDDPSAPSCWLDLTEAQMNDVVVRYQRSSGQLSLRAYEGSGTVEVASAATPCSVRTAPTGGFRSLSLGADAGGGNRGAMSVAWLRLFGTASTVSPATAGVLNPLLNYEFEDSLYATPVGLAPGFGWQTAEQGTYGNTPIATPPSSASGGTGGGGTTGGGPALANPSFDLVGTSVTVTAGTPTATAQITLIPKNGFGATVLADVTCTSPPPGITCGRAYPSATFPTTLSLSLSPSLPPGNYVLTLTGVSSNARGTGQLTVAVTNGGSSLAGSFGNRSLLVSPGLGYAAATYTSPTGVGDFRLEMRLHGLGAEHGTIVRTLADSGEPLGTLQVTPMGDLVQIRVTDLPGDFGGSYNCSVQLTGAQASDFVLRFQRAGGSYSLRTWNRSGLVENAPPASTAFCVTAPVGGGQLAGLSVGAPNLNGFGSASFQVAWLRLYGVGTPAAPGGLPAPNAILTYEFEESLASGTGLAALEWAQLGGPLSFLPTP